MVPEKIQSTLEKLTTYNDKVRLEGTVKYYTVNLKAVVQIMLSVTYEYGRQEFYEIESGQVMSYLEKFNQTAYGLNILC